MNLNVRDIRYINLKVLISVVEREGVVDGGMGGLGIWFFVNIGLDFLLSRGVFLLVLDVFV